MVMIFWVLIAAMTAAALLFVLLPLMRDPAAAERRRAEQALRAAFDAGLLDKKELARKQAALDARAPVGGKPPRATAALLAVLLPFTAAALYFHLGEPRALDASALARPAGGTMGGGTDGEAPPPSMEEAVQGLAKRLLDDPDNLDGWLLLGRAYKSMERFELAKQALSNAYRLAPEEPDVMIEFAEATALSTATRRIEGENLALIERAVDQQPDHQRGLWLLGVAAMQAGEAAKAVERWESLRLLITGDLAAVQSLDEQIEGARQAAGLPPSAASTATVDAPAAAPATTDGLRLTVTVDVAPALRSRLNASDVLFVFARAPSGSRMPLAIQRLPAANLPVTITLDDSHSMMPELKLSTMPEVVVGARISSSGQAIPQSGDLEGLSATIKNTTRDTIQLTIDQVVP
jgi:cytochrome c-type biogenesis protein CcmH